MSAVLPLAGVQRYFCTMNMEFVQGADDCPAEPKSCCAKKEKHKPTEPDCMASAKLLPNADKHTPIHIPSADGVWETIPVTFQDSMPTRLAGPVYVETERAPPDRSGLYADFRRLLI
ncbi:hypothetical protein HZ994_12920 [Akkermansiaceae bacterium]|nr:hypothetical protein HZ994_12920 [Akkermansiaceae bacterium]